MTKLCTGTAESPRFVLGVAYCPQCHRPVRFKIVDPWVSFTIMATQHYPDGTLVSRGHREGYRHFRKVTI